MLTAVYSTCTPRVLFVRPPATKSVSRCVWTERISSHLSREVCVNKKKKKTLLRKNSLRKTQIRMKITVKRATKIVKRAFDNGHKRIGIRISLFIYSILIVNTNYKDHISSVKRLTRIIENLHYKYWKERFQLNVLRLIYGPIEMSTDIGVFNYNT